MLQPRLTRVRERLDRLKAGAVSRQGGLLGAVLRLTRGRPPSLEGVEALDRELDRAGVHTSADARLLRELRRKKPGANQLAEGLSRRAAEALRVCEVRLRWLERTIAAGEPTGGALEELELAYPKLARAAKVADLFSDAKSAQASFEVLPHGPSASGRRFTTPKAAAAAFFAHRAKGNAIDLVQKRRDLDRAHELLLGIGNTRDREAVHALRTEVAAAREEARAEPQLASLSQLVKELRKQARRDPKAAFGQLRALYGRATQARDQALAEAALSALEPALELTPLEAAPEKQVRGADDALVELAFELRDEEKQLFELASGCARYFDVEEALGQEVLARGPIAVPRPRRVPYPTQTLTFDFTGALDELPNFVVSDPRMLLYDLAAGKQLVRAYLSDEAPPEPKRVKKSSVRVYVCDASGSMQGERARLRDAILLAELNNLRLKALRGEPFDPLYYTFFNDTPTELERVDSAQAAARHIEQLFDRSPASGQTDITLALIAAFDAIHAARGKDPYLGRATVVLITDGEDRVDLEVIRRTRAPMGALSVSLSFISLGEENPDLRSLVDEQRKKGERAFYHHLSDVEIASAPTDFDARFRTLVPEDVPLTDEAVAALQENLDQLDRIAAGQAARPPRSDASFDALFPEEPGPSSLRPRPEALAQVGDLLGAVVEAASLTLFEDRASEAVVLLTHLLAVYGITVPRYLELLGAGDEKVAAALARVRTACRPYG